MELRSSNGSNAGSRNHAPRTTHHAPHLSRALHGSRRSARPSAASRMKILALEFSSSQRSVAVAVDGAVRGHAFEQGGRETHAFALIDSALQQARVAREEIECVAVGIGP